VRGVAELVDKLLPRGAKLSICGHSFGSCVLTWLIHDQSLRQRIHHMILIDPVSLLLSEPDVMLNFLYTRELSKIRIMASSELFTEHYLRRHFAWYNSELWLEDVPNHVQILVALSEKDQIVNAPKVHQYVLSRMKNHPQMDLIYWKGMGHARVVTDVRLWRDVARGMFQQENRVAT